MNPYLEYENFWMLATFPNNQHLKKIWQLNKPDEQPCAIQLAIKKNVAWFYNLNLMYYEGITDTPFLFQWLFSDSEQAKKFVSN